ncbi:synaptotagmin-C-like isoform X2 [Stegodyphus dumicola]|uniref:synaptotagmin-C-like isoform X2 n=1 Tax=Stegodyphus dumicola TaxID=202533 RepID=UPI0015AD90A0|nr:synaptotagmin-C-like isoform X2 [Stegodyphus dumicola]
MEKKEDAEMKCMRSNFQVSFLDKEPPPPYEPTSRISFLDMKYPLELSRKLTNTNSVSSGCSDTDSVAGIPLPLLSDTEIPAPDNRETSPFEPGNVSITLEYKQIIGQDKEIFSQLRVDLKEADDLPIRVYGGYCNPYFIISLYDAKGFSKKKRRKSGPSPMHQFHSTVVKKSQHPIFNESFFFPLVQNEVKKCLLKIEAWDQDKLANDTLLGEIIFNLKDVASILLQEPSKALDLNLKLEDAKINNGQLLLGLCYLPTAERMTVAVLKANNLKRVTEKNSNTDFYVQGMAIYAGKVFERRKTSSRPSSPFPVFNEMLMFDVPFSKLDHIVLLLAIYGTLNQENGQQNAPKKESCVGKVIIGSSSRKNTLTHWNAMRNSPRRQVIQWHELK